MWRPGTMDGRGPKVLVAFSARERFLIRRLTTRSAGYSSPADTRIMTFPVFPPTTPRSLLYLNPLTSTYFSPTGALSCLSTAPFIFFSSSKRSASIAFSPRINTDYYTVKKSRINRNSSISTSFFWFPIRSCSRALSSWRRVMEW